MSPRAALFDLDGTLAETAADLIAGANAALAPLGAAHLDPLKDHRTAGRGGRAMLRLGLVRAGRAETGDAVEAEIDALMPPFLAAYEAGIARSSRLFPGVEAALDVLSASGWRLAVCTNKPERLARLLLERLGVLSRFDALIGADTLPVRKPDPRPVLEAARRAGADISRAVMVGDTVTDREAARAAGVPCVLLDLEQSPDELAALAPEALLSAWSELPAALERLMPEQPAARETAPLDPVRGTP